MVLFDQTFHPLHIFHTLKFPRQILGNIRLIVRSVLIDRMFVSRVFQMMKAVRRLIDLFVRSRHPVLDLRYV